MSINSQIGGKSQKIVVFHLNYIFFCFKNVSFTLCLWMSDGHIVWPSVEFAREGGAVQQRAVTIK